MPDVELTAPPLPGRDPVVLRWLVAPGGAVGAGQPLVILLTDRAEVALPAPGDGVLAERLVAEGAAATGALGRLRTSAVGGGGSRSARTAPEEAANLAAGASMRGGAGLALQPSAFRPVSPTARRIAAAHGLGLAGVAGSGPGGRVVKADVLAGVRHATCHMPHADAPAHDTAPVAPEPAPVTPGARRPGQAAASDFSPPPAGLTCPIITALVEADVTAALAVCAAEGAGFARLGLALSLTTYVAWVAAGLLPAHPLLQSSWSADGPVLRRRTHLAVAEGGAGGTLRWALVRHAGDLTLRGMARAVRDGATGDHGGATFSVVGLTTGAIRQIATPPLPGTGAALSLGAPRRTLVATDEGALVARTLLELQISFDARAIDYGQAMGFLRALREGLI